MLLWFAAIALIGLLQIIDTPMVLRSLSPEWAVHLFQRDPGGAFVLMGAIVLVITGTEAMFADMGHFGRRSIARAWWWGFYFTTKHTVCYIRDVVQQPCKVWSH